ncbi:MAG: hypothetical protein SF053_01745 [Bacteroidia bacterium]|nr:hypothetical protein [Bacteroidia bacterium]
MSTHTSPVPDDPQRIRAAARDTLSPAGTHAPLADQRTTAHEQQAIQTMIRRSPQVAQAGWWQALTQKRPTAAIQRYPTLDDAGRLDAVIYLIRRAGDDKIMYVGQTTADREFARFQEHTTRDVWAPWYIHATKKGLDYSGDPEDWPYYYEVIEKLKEVTKFETTVAEQWWMEYHLKNGEDLLNDSTPCTASNFAKRSGNPKLYNPKNIGVSASYEPSMKAK